MGSSGIPDAQTWSERLVALTHSKWLLPVLFAAQVAETTFVPWPYEVAFIALCLAARDRIWLFVLITALGSATAGTIMYTLGANFLDPISAFLGIEGITANYRETFAQEGGKYIFLSGLTPIPSYLINMIAGASGYPFHEFLALFTSSRFLRFLLLGGLLYLFGEQIVGVWERLPRYVRWSLIAFLAITISYWVISDFV
ncbi:VTT domain-containing protein [Hyphomonas sp. FCG-A18]|uniref:YqaA family protein n=1 Tax=Hyphomonas sp. FCG-A18 TaxID=3080019 RepID=UPI002B2E3A28|nr:VTT domain-containing protein [Hyphomonas sp. FCG-A18]